MGLWEATAAGKYFTRHPLSDSARASSFATRERERRYFLVPSSYHRAIFLGALPSRQNTDGRANKFPPLLDSTCQIIVGFLGDHSKVGQGKVDRIDARTPIILRTSPAAHASAQYGSVPLMPPRQPQCIHAAIALRAKMGALRQMAPRRRDP